MMHSKDSGHTATAETVSWRVGSGVTLLDLIPGDVLTFDPTKPVAERVTLTRTVPIHAGQLDRLQLQGTTTPVGLSILEARQRLVAVLLADRPAAA